MVKTQQREPYKSIWTKSHERSAARKYLTRNFKAGHITPNEHYLNRAGLRGRKRYIFLTIFVLVYIITIANLLITLTILGVLRFNVNGVTYFIFEADNTLLWPLGAAITDVRVASPLSGYSNDSLVISGKENPVIFQTGNQRNVPSRERILNPSQIVVDQSSVRFCPYTSLSLTGRDFKQLLLVDTSRVQLEPPRSLESLVATRITTGKLRTRTQGSLEVSGSQLNLRGAGGLSFGGRQVDITAGTDITLSTRSNEASIQLDGRVGGVAMQGLPQVSSGGTVTSVGPKYHLCACASGRLFLVPANSLRCAAANEMTNPCS